MYSMVLMQTYVLKRLNTKILFEEAEAVLQCALQRFWLHRNDRVGADVTTNNHRFCCNIVRLNNCYERAMLMQLRH